MLRFGAIFGLAFPSWCSYVSLRYRLLFGVPELMLSWCYTMLCFGGCLWQFGLPKLTLCFALAAVFSSSAFPPELKLCFGSAFPRWYGLPELMLCSFVLRRYNPRTPGSIRRGRPSMTTLSSWRLADTTTKEEEKRWTTKTIENPHDPLPCWCYAPSCCGGTILVLLDRFDARPSITTLSSCRLADSTTKEEEKQWTTKTIENPHDPLPCSSSSSSNNTKVVLPRRRRQIRVPV